MRFTVRFASQGGVTPKFTAQFPTKLSMKPAAQIQSRKDTSWLR